MSPPIGAGRTDQRRDKQRGQRILLRGLAISGCFLLLTALVTVWLSHRASEIQSNLEASLELVPDLKSQLLAAEPNGAEETLVLLKEHTEAAHRASTDPLWKAASHIPVIGANFAAVTEVTVSANDVVHQAVGPLVDAYESMRWQDVTPVGGKVNLEPVVQAAPLISTAASTVQMSHERLSAIDESSLIEQVAAPLERAMDQLTDLGGALNGASSAAKLLPSMLGSEDPRDYLLMIQNSAEIRSTGGVSGAVAIVSASGGRIELTAQGSASDMARFDPAVITDAKQVSIYGARMGRFMQSVNLTPDFPTAAETAAAMWEIRNEGSSIEGVIALDPVVLASILKTTGPVELTFEDSGVRDVLIASGLPTALTAENVVSTLLSDVYRAIEDPTLQDAYFAAVATEVFNALSSGAGEGSDLVRALTTSAGEGRLYLWSDDASEQEVIARTELAGSVTGAATGGAAFGAYFNDGTGAKMDYYVRRTVQLERSCTAEGYLQYTLTATLANIAPADAAESLPAYVTGGGAFGVPPGTVQTNFVAYGPDQSQLQTARIDGEPAPLGSYRHGDRPVGMLTTTLAPGQTVSVEVDFTNVVQTSEPTLDVTPTIQPIGEVVLPLKEETDCA